MREAIFLTCILVKFSTSESQAVDSNHFLWVRRFPWSFLPGRRQRVSELHPVSDLGRGARESGGRHLEERPAGRKTIMDRDCAALTYERETGGYSPGGGASRDGTDFLPLANDQFPALRATTRSCLSSADGSRRALVRRLSCGKYRETNFLCRTS